MTTESDHDTPELIIAQWQFSDPYAVRDTGAYSDAEITASPVLYLCNQPDPGSAFFSAFGLRYQPLIQNKNGHGIRPPKVAYGDSGSTAAGDAFLTLHNAPYIWQRRLSFGYPNRETGEAEVKLQQIFSQYLPGIITIWTVAAPYSGGTPTLQQIFKGRPYAPRFTSKEIRVQFSQLKDYDQVFPSKANPTGGGGPAIIDRISYPDAPSNVIGQSVPLVCCGDPKQDLLGLSAYQLLTINPQLLHGLAPMVMTRAKYDSGASSVGTIVGNKYPALGTPVDGIEMVLLSVPELNTLAVMDGSSPNIDSHEASYTLGLNEYATVVLNPNAHVSAFNVDDPQKAWDGKHDTYAVIKDNTGFLKLTVPNVSYLGAISTVYAFAFLGYGSATPGTGINTGAGGASVNGDIGIYEETFAAYYGSTLKNLTKDDIENGTIRKSNGVDYAGLTSPNVNAWNWQYVRTGTPNQLNLVMRTNVAGVRMRVYSCGFLVTYIPQNLWRERHVRELLPTIGVDGRVRRWEYK